MMPMNRIISSDSSILPNDNMIDASKSNGH
jgi:hypothetical protein